jgi:hypothetical protein
MDLGYKVKEEAKFVFGDEGKGGMTLDVYDVMIVIYTVQ